MKSLIPAFSRPLTIRSLFSVWNEVLSANEHELAWWLRCGCLAWLCSHLSLDQDFCSITLSKYLLKVMSSLCNSPVQPAETLDMMFAESVSYQLTTMHSKKLNLGGSKRLPRHWLSASTSTALFSVPSLLGSGRCLLGRSEPVVQRNLWLHNAGVHAPKTIYAMCRVLVHVTLG